MPETALRAPVAPGERRDLQPRVQRQLLHDVADVALDGMRRDVEPLSDLLFAQPLANQLDHFTLASRHAHVLEHALTSAGVSAQYDLGKEAFGLAHARHV